MIDQKAHAYIPAAYFFTLGFFGQSVDHHQALGRNSGLNQTRKGIGQTDEGALNLPYKLDEGSYCSEGDHAQREPIRTPQEGNQHADPITK
ncbi:hypothetical protein SDC9_139565 [bioreactor metagenome]|uniref:Uncharacterized protein n=1 Tax=bioreactor metagenome TaxID=1076179 RepID=A0A645DSG4_9ZZZZ